jgi:flagellar hook-associated protein FlgK
MRQSTGLKVIGDNLSNVNNSSYARKSVETSSFSGAGGAIYTSSSVTSARDSIADRQVSRKPIRWRPA